MAINMQVIEKCFLGIEKDCVVETERMLINKMIRAVVSRINQEMVDEGEYVKMDEDICQKVVELLDHKQMISSHIQHCQVVLHQEDFEKFWDAILVKMINCVSQQNHLN